MSAKPGAGQKKHVERTIDVQEPASIAFGRLAPPPGETVKQVRDRAGKAEHRQHRHEKRKRGVDWTKNSCGDATKSLVRSLGYHASTFGSADDFLKSEP